MKIEFIKDLFDKDFFTNLKNFIFEESFDEFYNRKLKENRDYSRGYTKFWLNSEYLENLNISIKYPLSYTDFIETYKLDGSCAKLIDKYIFYIKFLIKELFENKNSKYLTNEFYSIHLNKNILINFYDNEICKKLYNSKLKDLIYLNITTFKNKGNKNFKIIYTRSVLLYVFEYIETYLETLFENISPDLSSVIHSYTPETNMILINEIPNLSKEIRKESNQFKQYAKNLRIKRLNAESGTKPKELTGYFPYSKDAINRYTTKMENLLNEHPEIKKIIKIFKDCLKTSEKTTLQELTNLVFTPIKLNSIDKLKKHIYNILIENNSVNSYITLDSHGIKEFNTPTLGDDISELYYILTNYIDLIDENPIVSFSDAVKYTILEQSGNLHLFTNCKYKDETIKKFFNRKTIDEKLIVDTKAPKNYINKEFIEKYKTLFDF